MRMLLLKISKVDVNRLSKIVFTIYLFVLIWMYLLVTCMIYDERINKITVRRVTINSLFQRAFIILIVTRRNIIELLNNKQ